MPIADRRTMMKLTLAGTGAALASPAFAQPERANVSPAEFDHLEVRHRTVRIDGLDIFYREAGRPDAPCHPVPRAAGRHAYAGLPRQLRAVGDRPHPGRNL